MVHIKRVELTNFKSFGGTTSVPLLPGFTVVTGPNGSGKSNILDALLFCLGLAGSRGMRADKLPDLVNTAQISKARATVEASVTVTFDLSNHAPDEIFNEADLVVTTIEDDDSLLDEVEEEPPKEEELSEDDRTRKDKIKAKPGEDWYVTRRLRVTQQGTYTSNYYINGISCTLSELHAELEGLRVNPEGYNVVLQGDVTGIISMNARERREIIDELAGVAAFDRKIHQAKDTLEEVKEKEDSCRIIESELVAQCDRLAQDKAKAERYQKYRSEFLEKQKWEVVLSWRSLQNQQDKLQNQIQAGDKQNTELSEQLTNLNQEIAAKHIELEKINAHLKTLGDEQLLATQSLLANQEAEKKQLQRQQNELTNTQQDTARRLQQTQAEIQQHHQNLQQVGEGQTLERQSISYCQQQRDTAQQTLEQSRETAGTVAAASEAWVQQQTALNRQIETLLQTLEPLRTEQAQLSERNAQLQQQIQEQTELLARIEPELAGKQTQLSQLENEVGGANEPIQDLAQNLAATEQELQLQQETHKRLLLEQRDKQRQLDKLEAQAQAQQEAQGTGASKVIIQAGLPGVCGLVAELGRVEPEYQLALEIAAGARLANIVVEDDAIASAGIELLKQRRAGRATFLPLNKIQVPRIPSVSELRHTNGFIDLAINLVETENRFRDVFAYVFGGTLVFASLNQARSQLGRYRIVTLDGELLESSGAMTGGSIGARSQLRFGTPEAGESEEVRQIKQRLHEIERVLDRCSQAITNLSATVKQLSQELTESRQGKREQLLRLEALQKEVKNLSTQVDSAKNQLSQNQEKFTTARSRLQILNGELPSQEETLLQLRQTLAELEASQTPSEWQQIQAEIKNNEQQLQQRETALREAQQRLTNLESQQQRLQERIQEAEARIEQYQEQQQTQQTQLIALNSQHSTLSTQIEQTRIKLAELEANLGEDKKKRDALEAELRSHLLKQQQIEWEIQKLQESQITRREELANVQTQLQTISQELPTPLPEVPQQVDLEELQKELKSLTKRMQAMEPVNMLALEQYERTQNRLQELTQKLETLAGERTELLLRIENFTTLRQRAFKESFDAVNENFQAIFANLSDGDGYLQLDNPEDPFNSGLNMVAHPKGKPVQRLASMSGGEKSLTALSFIFALQKYRPSPFYAFDEVDSFLDGFNVERLSKVVREQSSSAQFIVVSHRRPMIESAERTIGVTQARGAYTQVLGITLKTDNTSA
ncbi:chromosome segregation protein SMC [Calothrix sp. UHCC 0171]|uniref:chromosome segregation protein SMC n=1 Tax=Calothrix sp. UHCC 0171 TaxID=3110245 RepID=UPI002B203FD0|nr:chromosome segregation protein SMC [Calothrix sp. UHCC 0171]MEA5573754.1 chromosome segregation protein SMC [Calothrix sp. UHCC 0171]